MKKILLTALPAIMLFSTPALATEGIYLGADIANNNIVGNDADFVDPASGFGLRAGYNFGSIAVEANYIQSDHALETGNGDAEFTGLSVDAHIFFTKPERTNQFYILTGFGSYNIDFTNGTDSDGSGFNLGTGLEHYFNERVAFNLAVIYRFIQYDNSVTVGTTTYTSFNKGYTLSLNVGLNYYF